MAVLTNVSADNRESPFNPIARRKISSPASGSVSTIASVPFSLNGELKGLVHNAEDMTDATFNFTILDIDGVLIYTENGISDNSRTPTNLTVDNIVFLSGDEYTANWTFSTPQTLNADDFQVILFVK